MILTVSSTSNASSIDRSVRASPLLDGPAPGRSRTESRGRSRACVAGVEKRSVMSVVARLYWFRRWKCLILGRAGFNYCKARGVGGGGPLHLTLDIAQTRLFGCRV